MILNKTVRIISFEKVYNFRDMGGYQTVDGRTVKYGLFYRSAALAKMTEQDKLQFETLGIKTIFDYRDLNEAANSPDPIFPNVQNIRIPAKGNKGFEMPNVSKKKMASREFYKLLNVAKFMDFFEHMPFSNPAFQRLMMLIQEPENLGILHHCAAGKDRTGIGSALILSALGVPRETIMEDFLASNLLLKPMIARIEKALSDFTEDEKIQFKAIMAADERYLNAAFKEIDKRYQTTAIFLEKEFGLTTEKLERLQTYCLE